MGMTKSAQRPGGLNKWNFPEVGRTYPGLLMWYDLG